MFCTFCNIEVEEESHYKCEVHNINVKRKLKGQFIIEDDNVFYDCSSENNSVNDVYLEEHAFESDIVFLNRTMKNAVIGIKTEFKTKCLFCDDFESPEHYIEKHLLTYEQVCYLYSKVCWICKESFGFKEGLKLHLVKENHKNVFTDGISLFLENGKVLHPKKHNFKQM
ncbi:hypothetical protein EHP00_29 [Ecytonucleospora hepatopenaei]|uniref:Uncharacterized protein n=1 Tax=Ecytonucleospora hepatopenaei TaxID=646526 RepID=A0A1W0E5Q3_9MICR|nr:hypothetical protein EHP00_29 [Ecytonucleospora hepatopenaei]